MFGRLLGKALALPVRIVNVPLRVVGKVTDTEGCEPLGDIADSIEETIVDLFGDEEDA